MRSENGVVCDELVQKPLMSKEKVIVWACSHADGACRVGRRGQRHRRVLPPSKHIRRLLQEEHDDVDVDWKLLAALAGRENVLDAWAINGEPARAGCTPVSSLLLCSPGVSDEGPLTPW